MTEALGRPVPFAVEPFGCSDRDKRTGLPSVYDRRQGENPNLDARARDWLDRGTSHERVQVHGLHGLRCASRAEDRSEGRRDRDVDRLSERAPAAVAVRPVTLALLGDDDEFVDCQAGGNEREPRVRSDTGPLTYQDSVRGGGLRGDDFPVVSRLMHPSRTENDLDAA